MNYVENKNILVVEDDDSLREIVAEEITFLGGTVFQARDGVEGLQILKTHSIDGVLSDVRMPNCNGIEFIKKVKDINAKTPVVIFMTGFSDLTIAQAMNLGAQDILPKPFELDQLDKHIQKLMTPPDVFLSTTKGLKNPSTKIDASFSQARLGRGGFFLPVEEVKENLSKDELVQFELKSESGLEIEGWAKIVFHLFTPPEGYGLEFVFLPKKSLKKMEEVIASDVAAYIPNGATSNSIKDKN